MAAPLTRLIDTAPVISSQPLDMSVLALGMSRTGSTSMYKALEMLGYKSFHMRHFHTAPDTAAYWVEGLKAKYHGEGKKYGSPELTMLLGDYSAVAGMPGNMFIEELLAAFPDAKVVTTSRDVDSWVRSITSSIGVVLGWNWRLVSPYDPVIEALNPHRGLESLTPKPQVFVQPYIEIAHIIWNQWTRGNQKDKGRLGQSFRDHYALISAKVPKDKLLEFNPQDGWGPLCKHLGRKVPEEAYPHVNHAPSFLAVHEASWWRAARKAVKTIVLRALVPVSVVAAGGFGYWYRLGE